MDRLLDQTAKLKKRGAGSRKVFEPLPILGMPDSKCAQKRQSLRFYADATPLAWCPQLRRSRAWQTIDPKLGTGKLGHFLACHNGSNLVADWQIRHDRYIFWHKRLDLPPNPCFYF